jgi:DNA-binding transcriptional ArsR family regulator
MDDSKFKALEEQIALISKELQNLRAQENTLNESNDFEQNDEFKSLKPQFDEAQTALMDIMKKMINANRMFIATCLSATSYKGQGHGIGTSFFNSLDNISEDGLSAALEPFSNPRRITILKALIEKPLTANELAKKTGLIGGQLYHHLSNLEKAGMINKEADKYHADGQIQGILAGLIAAIGGTKIARNDYGDEK